MKRHNMLLPRDQALRFIEGYKSALLQVLAAAGVSQTTSLLGDLTVARSRVKINPQELTDALAALETNGCPVDEVVARAICTMKISTWVYLKNLSQTAVFIDQKSQNAYAVKALTTPLDEVFESPPAFFETGVFEYCGHYVCDGIIEKPAMIGRNLGAQFKADYAEIKRSGRFYVKTAT